MALLQSLLLLLISPILFLISLLGLAGCDLIWNLFGRRRIPENVRANRRSASVVIPNWNGKDLLEKYLPSVIAALEGNGGNEIIVVDNGSEDGSAEFLKVNFPEVRVLGLPRNLGFGGGSNAGFHAAKNDIVVLLNSDMRVEPDFLNPLLEGFTDERVFAVACQIFLSDPAKRREETGLTESRWQNGGLRVGHRDDAAVEGLFPCSYAGGGSSAFDRRKFLELGGFDELLAPFYLEDTDLGYHAWKRGWKVLYQPRSVVFHEHRGTIGKNFRTEEIQAVLRKNFILFCWKNIHDWRLLLSHFGATAAGSLTSVLFGNAPARANLASAGNAFQQLPGALKSRWTARTLAVISDRETFARPVGTHYLDTFLAPAVAPEKPKVLFVSPYPILPPVHGGGVFMLQTLRELAARCEVHALIMLDFDWQLEANLELRKFCASAEFVVRRGGVAMEIASVEPHAVREFESRDFEWRMHRMACQHAIDVVQLEYTPLGQYASRYKRVACILFEHDVYFQSIGRGLQFVRSPLDRVKAQFEYLRALRYELGMLRKCDRVQVCTVENREYLKSFLPEMNGRIQDGLRAGIDTSRYAYAGADRKSFTMLFVGSFRHAPNQIALDWFARQVLPQILIRCPKARLLVAGSDPPPQHGYQDPYGAIEMLGFVEDIQPLFSECAVFVCPIRSGSGVRVKLLEAFASGIPVVSTRVGAEGLARVSGEICHLADNAGDFAAKVAEVLESPDGEAGMAARARQEVERNWDTRIITERLVASYTDVLREKRAKSTAPA